MIDVGCSSDMNAAYPNRQEGSETMKSMPACHLFFNDVSNFLAEILIFPYMDTVDTNNLINNVNS